MATASRVDIAPLPPVRQPPPREEPPPPRREESPPPAKATKEPVAEKEVGGTVNVEV